MAEDKVIREIDVFVGNGNLGDTELHLLQFPLRPPWRPYELDAADTVRFKPEARKLRMDVPLDTRADCYDTELAEDDPRRVSRLRLHSTRMEMGTSFAVGTVRGDKMVLVALNDAFQLRPDMSHLSAEADAAKKKKTAAREAEKAREGPKPVTVQLQKRETERQAELRLNSYAHLRAKEEGENWSQLNASFEGTAASARTWEKLMTPVSLDPADARPMPREDYLASIVPIADPDAAAAGSRGKGNTEPLLQEIEGDMLADFQQSMRRMFRKYSLASADDMEAWLLKDKESGRGLEAMHSTLPALKKAVDSLDLPLDYLEPVWVLTQTGNNNSDPLRAIMIEILKTKKTFKRSDIEKACNAKDVKFTEGIYMKTAKEICTGEKHAWSIRESHLEKPN